MNQNSNNRFFLRYSRLHAAGAALLLAALVSCGRGAVEIGFIAGLSGANADLGEAGRNGAMIAVDRINDTGGITDRSAVLLVRDDENNTDTAKKNAAELAALGCEAIIGPFNASMVDAVRTVTEDARILVITPTASALHLAGKKDWLFKLNSSTRENTIDYVSYLTDRRGFTRVSAAVDQQNKSFSESWYNEFLSAFSQRGGSVVSTVRFDLSSAKSYAPIVEGLLKESPQAVVMVANSVDVARIAQQLRKSDENIPIIAAEWAGTQLLIELGGAAVTGAAVLQIYDRFSESPSWLSFRNEYIERFSAEPSYSSLMAYEAVLAAAKGMNARSRGEDLRHAVIRTSPHTGLQKDFSIDENGDSRRDPHFVVIEGNTFRKAQ